MAQITAIVVGGGIGGLTAALSLQRVGVDVTVYESSREILPLGVGINLLPQAVRELIALGLQPALDATAIRTRAMAYYTNRAQPVLSVPCGLSGGYRCPQYSIHRGELQTLLLRSFQDAAGENKVCTGHHFSDFEQTDDGVTAHFVDRATGKSVRSVSADILIGADGIHSALRKRLFPAEGAPVYSGVMVYRGAVERAPLLDGETMVIVGDLRKKIVAYPVSALARQRGSSHVNWLVGLQVDADTVEEDWNRQTGGERLQAEYADWRFDWLDVPAIISSTESIFEYPLQDRDPLPQWTFGRVTLLGDAAHPMIPVSSNGAVQAIIDGRALAYALATHPDPVSAFAAYEAERLPQANRVVEVSRRNGPDEILEIVRRECPEDAEDIHAHVPEASLRAVIEEFKVEAGFDAETLNDKPSYDVAPTD